MQFTEKRTEPITFRLPSSMANTITNMQVLYNRSRTDVLINLLQIGIKNYRLGKKV